MFAGAQESAKDLDRLHRQLVNDPAHSNNLLLAAAAVEGMNVLTSPGKEERRIGARTECVGSIILLCLVLSFLNSDWCTTCKSLPCV